MTDEKGKQKYHYDVETILGRTAEKAKRKINWKKMLESGQVVLNEEGKPEVHLGKVIERTGDPSLILGQETLNIQSNAQMRRGRKYATMEDAMKVWERGRGERKIVTAEEAGVSRKGLKFGRNPYRDKLMNREPSEEDESQ